MDLLSACKLAKEYYSQERGCEMLSEIRDLGEKWLFYPEDDINAFGRFHITVRKDDGEIEPFFLPSKENFELLHRSVEVAEPH